MNHVSDPLAAPISANSARRAEAARRAAAPRPRLRRAHVACRFGRARRCDAKHPFHASSGESCRPALECWHEYWPCWGWKRISIGWLRMTSWVSVCRTSACAGRAGRRRGARQMAGERDRVIVNLDAVEIGPRQAVGTLVREQAAAKSVISFAYEPDWVGAPASFSLDPSLPLYEGEQYPPALPGIFADAAPDRWGRTLLERREALAARREGRRQRRLDDWDYLVGVSDRTRMGALRFAPARRRRICRRWRADDPTEHATARPRALGPRAGAWATRGHRRRRALDRDPDRARQLARRGKAEGELSRRRVALDRQVPLPGRSARRWRLGVRGLTARRGRRDRGSGDQAAAAGLAVPNLLRAALRSSRREPAALRLGDDAGGTARSRRGQLSRRCAGDRGPWRPPSRSGTIFSSSFAASCSTSSLRIATTTSATTDSCAPAADGAFRPPSTSIRRCRGRSTAWPSTTRCGSRIWTSFARRRRTTASPRQRVEEVIAEVDDAVARWPAAARDAGLPEDEVERFAGAFRPAVSSRADILRLRPHPTRAGAMAVDTALQRADRDPARHHRDGAPVRRRADHPQRRALRPRGHLPGADRRADEGAGPVRGDDPRGVRRDGARPDHLRDDRRGALARLDLDLRRRQHPLHRLLPADEVRHRRAEGLLPAEDGDRARSAPPSRSRSPRSAPTCRGSRRPPRRARTASGS